MTRLDEQPSEKGVPDYLVEPIRPQYTVVPRVSQSHLFSVQFRPMVRNMAKALLHDVSMLERLYIGLNGMSKTMLNVSLCSSGTLAFPLIIP